VAGPPAAAAATPTLDAETALLRPHLLVLLLVLLLLCSVQQQGQQACILPTQSGPPPTHRRLQALPSLLHAPVAVRCGKQLLRRRGRHRLGPHPWGRECGPARPIQAAAAVGMASLLFAAAVAQLAYWPPRSPARTGPGSVQQQECRQRTAVVTAPAPPAAAPGEERRPLWMVAVCPPANAEQTLSPQCRRRHRCG
jgi:hypothetical protein